MEEKKRVSRETADTGFDRDGVLFFWLPLVAYMALIFYLSSRPDVPNVLPGLTFGDKIIHLAAYVLLALLWGRAITRRWTAIDDKKVFVIAVLCTGLYGISDEIHQSFVPGRSADSLDAIADIAGAMVGARLYIRYKRSVKATSAGGIKELD